MAGRQVNSKKQKSREAAVNRLIKEITLTRKAADEFLRTTGTAEHRAALLTAPSSTVRPYFEYTYEQYKCICKRVKLLQNLLESMEDTAKRIGSNCSYLN